MHFGWIYLQQLFRVANSMSGVGGEEATAHSTCCEQVAGTWNQNEKAEKTQGDFMLHRGIGLVTDVFSTNDLNNLEGNCAIGHTRYSTAGGKSQVSLLSSENPRTSLFVEGG